MDFDKYKSANEKISVPSSLIQETVAKMREAQDKHKQPEKIGFGWYVALAAACVMIVVLVPVLLNISNSNIILTELNDNQFTQQVALKNGTISFHESDDVVLPPYLGNPENKENPLKPSIAVTTAQGGLPEQCDTSLPMDSVINGTQLCVGVYGINAYFAQFIHNGVGYYIEGENITQAEFIMEIYKILK